MICRNLRFVCLLSCLLACVATQRMQAQVLPNRLVLDVKGSEIFASENIQTLHSLMAKGEDEIMPPRMWQENTRLKKLAGIGYRGAKLALLDYPMSYMFMLGNHEIFGHGARAREFGATTLMYELHLPPPYGPGSGAARWSYYPGFKSTYDISATTTMAGDEANSVLAWQMESRFFQSGRIHYHDAMLDFLARNNQLGYIWLQKFYARKGIPLPNGDIGSYVFSLNNKYQAQGKQYSIDRLAAQSLVMLLNPFQYYGVWSMGMDYVIKGKTVTHNLPMIRIGSWKYLPAAGYNLTPFGSEFILMNYAQKGDRQFQLQLNVGDGYFETFFGGSFTAHRLVKLGRMDMGVQAGGWQQPAIRMGGDSIYYLHGGPGFFTKLDFTYMPAREHPDSRLYLQVGYKMDGYLMGEPLRHGLILRGGAEFCFREK